MLLKKKFNQMRFFFLFKALNVNKHWILFAIGLARRQNISHPWLVLRRVALPEGVERERKSAVLLSCKETNYNVLVHTCLVLIPAFAKPFIRVHDFFLHVKRSRSSGAYDSLSEWRWNKTAFAKRISRLLRNGHFYSEFPRFFPLIL